jgi:hypothetical protein
MGERRTVNASNVGDNSKKFKNTKLDIRAIHIHGGMEHNLARYAKYCSCGRIKILGNTEFTKEIHHSRRDFSRHW